MSKLESKFVSKYKGFKDKDLEPYADEIITDMYYPNLEITFQDGTSENMKFGPGVLEHEPTKEMISEFASMDNHPFVNIICWRDDNADLHWRQIDMEGNRTYSEVVSVNEYIAWKNVEFPY